MRHVWHKINGVGFEVEICEEMCPGDFGHAIIHADSGTTTIYIWYAAGDERTLKYSTGMEPWCDLHHYVQEVLAGVPPAEMGLIFDSSVDIR